MDSPTATVTRRQPRSNQLPPVPFTRPGFTCPFCHCSSDTEYVIRLHIEEQHTAGSPFVAHGRANDHSATSSSSSDDRQLRQTPDWIKCSRPNCGEMILSTDMDEHVALHIATDPVESASTNYSPGLERSTSRGVRKPITRKSSTKRPEASADTRRKDRGLLSFLAGHVPTTQTSSSRPRSHPLREPRNPGRLGERELGPHAYEKEMPASVRRHLLEDALPHYAYRINPAGRLDRIVTVDNETSGLVRVLGDLCALDTRVERTYLCHPDVKHIFKIPCDGNFCGYWNIQMLLSYLYAVEAIPGSNKTPNVLEIQDGIETAWDNGICAYGHIETGGVRNTRKWIGSHEALAYLTQIGVPVHALSFREVGPHGSELTVLSLLDYVEAYFVGGLEDAKRHCNSYTTRLAPIYFQRFGHSTTIVGLEKKKDGFRNLLVFDPSFATPEPIKRLLAGHRTASMPDDLLKVYRRSDTSLTRWSEFEIVLPRTEQLDKP